MTILEMKERKKELGYSNEQIAVLSGVPVSTVRKVLGGTTASPRFATLQKLEAVLGRNTRIFPAPGQSFEMHQAQILQPETAADPSRSAGGQMQSSGSPYSAGGQIQSSGSPYSAGGQIQSSGSPYSAGGQMQSSGSPYSAMPPMMVREALSTYGEKRQGEYTLDDYYALPDDRRAELIDGVFYDMASPTSVHQAIISALHISFQLFVRSRGGSCKVFLPPYDIQLDRDNKTMVQPDLTVICNRDIIRMHCCYGPPDLVIEVLSPSTRKKDIQIKTMKYGNAGVREYWMIDPDKRQILVYEFTKEEFPRIYGFDSKVPAGIWDGALEVDFAEISREIAYLYENENPVTES